MVNPAVELSRGFEQETFPARSNQELPFELTTRDREIAQIYTLASVSDLKGFLRDRTFSAEELLRAAYSVVHQVDRSVNAVAHLWSYEDALAELARSAPGPFQGIPILSKFSRERIEGKPYTLGFDVLENLSGSGGPHLSTETAPLVESMRKSGLYVIGDTRLSQACLTPTCGEDGGFPAHNPWGYGFSPGGSSGGAAIAIATGMAPLATATDSAGSIRIPASYTGSFGLKPTGIDLPGGMLGHLSVSHVISRHVEDSKLYFENVTGRSLDYGIVPSKMRVGLLCEMPGLKTDAECVRGVMKVAKFLESQGHEIETIQALPVISDQVFQPSLERLSMYYAAMVVKQLGDWLGRPAQISDMSAVTWTLANGGIANLANFSTDLEYIKSLPRRFSEATSRWDLLLTPTVYRPPPRIGEILPRREDLTGDIIVDRPYLEEMINRVSFTAPFNATGNPACSVPVHFTPEQDRGVALPIGVQLIAKHNQEEVLFKVSHELEQQFRWNERTAPLHALNLLNL